MPNQQKSQRNQFWQKTMPSQFEPLVVKRASKRGTASDNQDLSPLSRGVIMEPRGYNFDNKESNQDKQSRSKE